jgi:ribonuclease P protein component
MPAPDWLALKVVDAPSGAVFFSVPKKVVRLATRRNRLKRLLREAVRARTMPPGAHQFRVARDPGPIGLADAASAMDKLLKKLPNS